MKSTMVYLKGVQSKDALANGIGVEAAGVRAQAGGLAQNNSGESD